MAMLRDTKLGYGFSLVGTGVPYLIEHVLGLSYAIVVSVACVVLGGAFLLAGHRHKEGEVRQKIKIWEILAFGAALSTLIWLGSVSILRVTPKQEETKQNPEEPTIKESAQGLTVTSPVGGWLTFWGVDYPDIAHIDVDHLGALMKYASHFHLLFTCRVADDTIDEMEDTTIEKSQLFTITGPRLTMKMQMSQSLMARAYPQKNVRATLIMVPWTVRPEQISKLSDVAKHGGAILGTYGFTLAVQQKKVPLKGSRKS